METSEYSLTSGNWKNKETRKEDKERTKSRDNVGIWRRIYRLLRRIKGDKEEYWTNEEKTGDNVHASARVQK